MLVLGVVVTLLSPIMDTARPAARTATCTSNLKQIRSACALDMDDFDSHFPPAERWQDAVLDYADSSGIFTCPASIPGRSSYAFNAALGGLSYKKIARPADAPVFFDSSLPGPNAADRGQSFARRHEQGGRKGLGNVVFTDGHVRALPAVPSADAGRASALGGTESR